MTGALLSQIYISDLEQLPDNNAVKEPMVENVLRVKVLI